LQETAGLVGCGADCCNAFHSLQVDDDATAEEIKRAYRSMAKECHPDYLGDKGHNICILLNEAYEVSAMHARNSRVLCVAWGNLNQGC
jgi:hypothetical protein